jgi:hypothetical protein
MLHKACAHGQAVPTAQPLDTTLAAWQLLLLERVLCVLVLVAEKHGTLP